jgi:hypothetical protein
MALRSKGWLAAIALALAALPACGAPAAPGAPPAATAALTALPAAVVTPTPAPPQIPVPGAAPSATPPDAAPATVTLSSPPPGTPAARATATAEPESCFRAVGAIYNWYDLLDTYQPGDAPKLTQSLASPCVEDRWLSIWALGSAHDPAALPALDAYLAAHPAGDWFRDEFDLAPVARAAISYTRAPLDPTRTYTVRNVTLYPRAPTVAADAVVAGPEAGVLPAGAAITLLERLDTHATRPDHGGETAVVFERFQPAGDSRAYYLDISAYVAALPAYFRPPAPRIAPGRQPGATPPGPVTP